MNQELKISNELGTVPLQNFREDTQLFIAFDDNASSSMENFTICQRKFSPEN